MKEYLNSTKMDIIMPTSSRHIPMPQVEIKVFRLPPTITLSGPVVKLGKQYLE